MYYYNECDAPVGWGKVMFSHVSVCLFTRGVPHLGDWGGASPSQVQAGGTPSPSAGWGTPPSRPGKGVPPTWTWEGVATPRPDLGREYCPAWTWEEVPPCPDLEGGTPPPPSPGQVQGRGYPNQNSIACTCYAAGGMPLAFTQEDFLVTMNVTPLYVACRISRLYPPSFPFVFPSQYKGRSSERWFHFRTEPSEYWADL